MADNIDSLQIEISANAQKADKALDNLVKSLDKLSSSLGGMQTSKFYQLADGMSKFASSMAGLNTSVKAQDFTRIATGLNKISTINASGIRSASVAMQGLSKSLSNMSFISFDSQGIASIANSVAQLGRKTVTQAAANIPKLTASLSELVTGLNRIGTVNFDVSGLSGLTSSITKLGGKSATNAVPNIEKLAVALKNMMSILSTAPKVSNNIIQMTQALAQLASNGTRAGRATTSLAGSLNIFSSSAKDAKKHTFSLAAAFGKFYATYWLLIRGLSQFKEAIDISSDLTEVQNVVDVTFGAMADKVEDLASHSIKDFGMSELTTKQIASRFQAMGTAMGFTQEKMSDMSIELTKLAADMASFYNVAQEDVAKSLQSIFTGETEPMRKYGVDLTNATVQQWALNNGIKANMSTMTNAEKTLLRYQYTLEAASAATGDFANTSGSWANQLRVLTQSFQALGAIVGEVLINAFKPFIQALNKVMQSVINFARTVANALGNIFGWTYEVSGGGITDDFESVGSSTEDIEDNLGGAADNAKKLKDYVLGIDELNILKPEEADKGSGSGAGGAGGGAGAGDAGGEWIKGEGLLEKYKSSIDSLYELGAYISKVLTDALNSIDWNKIYLAAAKFGTGLAEFLNGLITPELFGALGRTIAGALNAVLYSLSYLSFNFDWKNLGESIAEGVNEFFRTFDFRLLAHAINSWANGLLDAMLVAVKKIKWRKIGEQIGDFLEKIDFMKIGKKVGQLIWEAIQAGLDVWNGMFDVAPVETTIITAFGAMKIATVAQPIITQLKKIVEAFKLTTGAIQGNQADIIMLSSTYPKLSQNLNIAYKAFVAFKDSMSAGGNIFSGLASAANTLNQNLSAMSKLAIGAIAGFVEFNFVKDNIQQIILGTDDLIGSIGQIAIAVTGAAAAFSAVFGVPAGLIITGVVAAVSAIAGIVGAFNEVKETHVEEYLEGVTDGFTDTAEAVRTNADALEKLSDKAKDYQKDVDVEKEKIERLKDKYFELADQTELTAEQQNLMKYYADQLIEAVPELSGLIDETTGRYTAQKDALLETIEAQEQYYQLLAYQDLLGEYNKNLAEANVNLDKNNAQYERLKTEYDNLQQSMEDYMYWKITESEFVEKTGLTYKEAELALSSMGDEIKENRDANAELIEKYNEATESLGYVEERLASAQTEFESTQATVDAMNFANLSIKATEAIDEMGGAFIDGKQVVGQAAVDVYQEIMNTYGSLGEDSYTLANGSVVQFGNGLEDGASVAIPIAANTMTNTLLSQINDVLIPQGKVAMYSGGEVIIQEMISGADAAASQIKQKFSSYAIFADEGWREGLLSEEAKSKASVETWTQRAIKGPFEQGIEIGSPSKLFERYAGWVVQGFNNGILSEDSTEAMNTWLESIKATFSIEKWSEVFSNIGLAFQQKWTELVEWWNGTAIVGWWENSVLPWFSAEKWNELLAGVLLGFQTKFTEIFNFVSTIWTNLSTTTTNWWNTIKTFLLNTFNAIKTNVVDTWTYFWTFISQKWTEIFDKTSQIWENTKKFLNETFKELSENILEKWTEFKDTISEKWDEIWEKTDEIWKKAKDFLFDTILQIKDELYSKLEIIQNNWDEAMNFLLETVNNIFDGIRNKVSEVIDWALDKIGSLASAISDVLSGLGSIASNIGSAIFGGGGARSISLPGYASGGFPERGELFMARENGITEMVGSIGVRSAVANNDQIVAGISSGVRAAVIDVVVPYLEDLRDSNSVIAAKDMSVNIGDRQIAQANMRGQRSLGYGIRTV